MHDTGFDIVTGAFGYSGRYITQMLLDRGRRVRTLTGHPGHPHPFGDRVEALPFNFDAPDRLTASLRGVDTLYNTYWVRFNRGEQTLDCALANSRVLIRAAAEAGVRRFVHISIANPSADSPFPYYRGKAAVERALAESGLSYAVLRPTVLVGEAGILVNNIAWMLRRLPVFGIFGDGSYQIQPAYVGDVAALAVASALRPENLTVDAVGPETFTFNDFIRLIRERIGAHARIIHIPPWLGLTVGAALGRLTHDVVITPDEIGGLMANLLISHHPPTCPTRFSDWLEQHQAELGREYQSELRRHF